MGISVELKSAVMDLGSILQIFIPSMHLMTWQGQLTKEVEEFVKKQVLEPEKHAIMIRNAF